MDISLRCYIGEAARKTGATPKAIRLYEKMKLIPKPERKGTYRIYSNRHIERIILIKQAQSLGFKLSEIKKILAGKVLDCNIVPWDDITVLVNEKITRNVGTISKLEKQTRKTVAEI